MSIIQKVAQVPDLLGELKVNKRTVISSNSFVRVNYKANVEFEAKQKSLIFQPLVEPEVDEALEIKESYKFVKTEGPHAFLFLFPTHQTVILFYEGEMF